MSVFKILFLVSSLLLENNDGSIFEIFVEDDKLCTLDLVESIPEGLVYNNSKPNLSTFEVRYCLLEYWFVY